MPRTNDRLTIPQELLLLALNDERGTFFGRAHMCEYALAGGIVAELLFAERVQITDDRKQFLDLVDDTTLDDQVLDNALASIRDAKRRTRLKRWVMRLGKTRLRRQIAEQLCARGVLREEEGKILWIFTRRLYPERDPRYERRLIERLRKAIYSDAPRVDPRTATLVALADGAELLTIPFDKRELRTRKQRIKRISEGDMISKAAGDVARAARAAVIAAITAANVAAISAATS